MRILCFLIVFQGLLYCHETLLAAASEDTLSANIDELASMALDEKFQRGRESFNEPPAASPQRLFRTYLSDDSADAAAAAESLVRMSKSINEWAKRPVQKDRRRLVKKLKTINYNGLSMDTNIETFKSHRFCHYNEICKNKYKSHFECICPQSTVCVGHGSYFEARCSTNIMPYMWIQSPKIDFDESSQTSGSTKKGKLRFT